MKEILAYSNSARPLRADEGQVFINVKTMEMFIFHDGYWRPFVELPKKEAKVMVFPELTPSTPEKELPEESTIINTDEPPVTEDIPAVVEEAPKPKKKSTKKSTKKEASK